jgi:hypothetical protein
MGRAPCELLGDSQKVEAVACLELNLADPVLLSMMLAAQADGPAIGGFEARSAVGAAAHVGAFYGKLHALWHDTMMPPHPGAMRWTRAVFQDAPRPGDPLRQKPRHEPRLSR